MSSNSPPTRPNPRPPALPSGVYESSRERFLFAPLVPDKFVLCRPSFPLFLLARRSFAHTPHWTLPTNRLSPSGCKSHSSKRPPPMRTACLSARLSCEPPASQLEELEELLLLFMPAILIRFPKILSPLFMFDIPDSGAGLALPSPTFTSLITVDCGFSCFGFLAGGSPVFSAFSASLSLSSAHVHHHSFHSFCSCICFLNLPIIPPAPPNILSRRHRSQASFRSSWR